MRVLGPNCLGLVNTDPEVRLNATPRAGGAAAGPGRVLLPVRRARHRHPGRRRRAAGWACPRSSRPATGPTCRGNDLLQYWHGTTGTEVVLLYLEIVRQPAQVRPAGPEAGPHQAGDRGEDRPARAVTPGLAAVRSAGARAAVAGAVRAVRRDPGARPWRRRSTPPSCWPTSRCRRATGSAIVGNSTALGVLVVDALPGEGLELAGGPGRPRRRRQPGGSRRGGAARPRRVGRRRRARRGVRAAGRDARHGARRGRCATRSPGCGKPVVSTSSRRRACSAELAVPGADGVPARGSVPCYPTPGAGGRRARRGPSGTRAGAPARGRIVRPAGIDVQGARALVDRDSWASAASDVLDDDERIALLRCYGIEMLPFRRGPRARRRPSPWRASSGSRWRSRRPPSSGGTGSTARACG